MSNGLQPSLRRVGIVGAGQLARMMGEVAPTLGIHITVLADTLDDAAVATCDEAIIGAPKDPLALDHLARLVDVVTFDHELVDLEHVRDLETRGVLVRPSAHALSFAVDKAHQRRAFRDAEVPVPKFLVVSSVHDERLRPFLDELDGPPVLKAARGGYDGRGVLFPATYDEAVSLIGEMCASGEVVIEERLTLHGEVAQLIARSVDGQMAIYPLVTTVQANGMCIETDYPALATNEINERAHELGEQIASLIDAVGVLAIEFFITPTGLLVNEIALRPHNSGHWTIEGTRTSQFANHLLCVSGEEPGDVTAVAPCAVMVNVVGSDQPGSFEQAQKVEGAFVHDYGKSWRPDRKLGHVTVLGESRESAHVRAWRSAIAYGTRTREV
ncbi:MAG: 5-(carboxyamino)imidazole ribonucleotide synthase [Acidimicrobiales bacterium]